MTSSKPLYALYAFRAEPLVGAILEDIIRLYLILSCMNCVNDIVWLEELVFGKCTRSLSLSLRA
jgi:hypothetical protein